MIQNAPKRTHVTPLFISLHWLPVAACIKFKTLMLAYRTATGSASAYFHTLMTIYIPSRSLRSASERCLMVPSQRGSKSLSRIFSFTRVEWPSYLYPECWIPVNLQATTENSSLSTLLDFILKKKKKSSYFLFIPSLASLFLFEQCLRLGITSTSSASLRWIASCIPQV